jgi:hypothetical protein
MHAMRFIVSDAMAEEQKATRELKSLSKHALPLL